MTDEGLRVLVSDDDSEGNKKIDLSYLQLEDEPLTSHLLAFLGDARSIDAQKEQQDQQDHEDLPEGPEGPLSLCDEATEALYLQHNQLTRLPESVVGFQRLRVLDLSSNRLRELGDEILGLVHLTELFLRNNLLEDRSLPKDFGLLKSLEELNLSGNRFTTVVPQILELENLKGLFLGSNRLVQIPAEIWRLHRLKVLYLGGNDLHEIPAEMGHLQALQALILCENKLESLPSTISHLRRLRSLALHKNRLTTLPRELVRLQGLAELSLRDNPLVVRFVRDMVFNPPTLLELSARMVKQKNIPYKQEELPHNLLEYLKTAHRCVNPKCKGVYFNACVEHIKFVDFCGKYRIPLLQYLCSSRCTPNNTTWSTSSESEMSEDDCEVSESRLRKVLLG